ncbi:AAA family ATPase [Mycolicibacterium elephantis]
MTARLADAAVACGLDHREVQATLQSAQSGADKYGPADVKLFDNIAAAYSIAPGQLDGPPQLASLLLTRSALRELPDPEPLIDNTLDQGTQALLYGKWGSGKSFIALDWAASVATGRPWQNRQTQQRKVLYLAAEGAYGFKARVDAWEVAWRTKIRDDDLHILPTRVNLTRPVEVAELLHLVDWGRFGFVIIDTLARCMVGADENSAKDCGEVVDALTRLREATPGGRGVVLGVHHTGKDGKTFRGSSVFEAGADTVYSVATDGGTIRLDREKRKDGPEDDRHELKLDPIEGTGSVAINVHRDRGHSGCAGHLLSAFVHHFAESGATKSELRNVAELPSSSFHRALNELLTSGSLTNTGTDKRPFYLLAS